MDTMFKFLHTADIHLDSPLLNLDKYEGAPVEAFRSATRRAFDNIVELAIREEVHFVIVAGDLYDGDCSDFNTPRHFRRQMKQLGEHNIRVFLIQGNHDAANNMRKAFRLQLPDNVKLFGTRKPETELIEDLGVAIHGQGFAQREVTEDLSKNYPTAIPGLVNIGILHTSCGSHDQHATYAPSTVKGLSSKGYDYWALGHIHKHETVSGPNPWIIYSGNPQGRSVRETGPRGCVIATYDDDRITIKRHNVDVMRWAHLTIEADNCPDAVSTLPLIQSHIASELSAAGDRPMAVRLELTGATDAHDQLSRQSDYWDMQVREHVLDQFDEHVWVEKIKFQTRSRAERSVDLESALGDLIHNLTEPDVGRSVFTDLHSDFEKLLMAVPTDPRLSRKEIDINDPETAASILEDARELLIARLLCPEHDE